MIVIFEGNENTGKTNIAKELSYHIKIPYFKNKIELNNPFFIDKVDLEEEIKYIWRFMISFLQQTKYSAIFDRSYISEYVYGNVLRKENFENKKIIDYIKMYDKLLSEMDCYLIYCYKTSSFEKDDYICINDMPAIIDYYNKYLNFTKLKYIQLDTTDQNLTNQVNVIKNFIKHKTV